MRFAAPMCGRSCEEQDTRHHRPMMAIAIDRDVLLRDCVAATLIAWRRGFGRRDITGRAAMRGFKNAGAARPSSGANGRWKLPHESFGDSG
jgi:hypothetical protein